MTSKNLNLKIGDKVEALFVKHGKESKVRGFVKDITNDKYSIGTSVSIQVTSGDEENAMVQSAIKNNVILIIPANLVLKKLGAK